MFCLGSYRFAYFAGIGAQSATRGRLAFVLNKVTRVIIARLGRCGLARAIASRDSRELAALLIVSLAGLDLSLWLVAKGLLLPSDLLNAFLLLG